MIIINRFINFYIHEKEKEKKKNRKIEKRGV